jgi:hypothetical protein
MKHGFRVIDSERHVIEMGEAYENLLYVLAPADTES